MKFNYSNKRLFALFMIRFLPSLIFWVFAMLWGNIFWLVTLILWSEAVVETIWCRKRGYLSIDENRLCKHLLFLNDELHSIQVGEVFAYGNEWTFVSKDRKIEIKIIKNYVQPKQRESLDKLLNDFWANVRKGNASDATKPTEF
ncbi:MAG: hypothetical protein PHO74_00695 [Weeksellaceae bacterium]|nr:hypothetical protein [Weeksellaceae bacterium]